MSVQILIGALLIGDVPGGYGHLHHHAACGDGHRVLPPAPPHPISSAPPALATKAGRLTTPALDTAASRAASLPVSCTPPLFRPVLRHILMPPGS